MEKSFLDLTMAPLGLLIMVAYHVWLIRRVVKHPGTTVMGVNAVNRKIWVKAMMDVRPHMHSLSLSLSVFRRIDDLHI